MRKISYRQILVSEDKYDIKCPYEMRPEYVTVHNTANDASAENEIKYMISNNEQVSFHYAVDDKEAVQGILTDRNTWNAGDGANGDGNRKSIAVEICYSKSGGERFIEAEKNAAQVVADLLHGWDLGLDRVRTHRDWSGKYCPHRTLDMGWERFMQMVTEAYNEAEEKKPENNESPISTMYLNLNSNIDTWRVYPMNVAPVKGNECMFLKPSKFGGLSYTIKGYTQPNVAIIETRDFGQVQIFIGAGTEGKYSITNSPVYDLVK